MTEGTFQTLEIDAPAEAIYDAAADIGSYPEWATGVKEVEGFVKEIEYVLRYTHDRPNSLSWVAEEDSKDVKMLEGSYTFNPVDGATEVIYALSVEPNFIVPGFLRRQAEKQIVTTALRGLRKRVTGSG
jgi:uncharacterized membrane protein